MINKITISGKAGSGKSTIGKHLAELINYEFISVGELTRKYAKQNFQMNIQEFQKLCTKNPNYDLKMDEFIIKYGQTHDRLILDYRLGFKFIPEALSIYLRISKEEAAKRLLKSIRKDEFMILDYENILKDITTRNNNMRERFKLLYNTDFYDEANYNLIIDVTYLSINEITTIIINNL